MSTITAMLFLFAFAPTSVRADCAADIETVEEEIESGGGSKRAEAEVRAATEMVEKARAALAEGKKKRCEKLIKKAQDKLGNS